MNVSCIPKQKCYSCRACEQSCYKNCISMQEDSEGFLYPLVDEKKCVQCEKCLKSCPSNNLYENKKIEQKYYGLKSKNINLILKSSSGGAFAEFASYILSKKGIVFGAAWNENLQVFQTECTIISDLHKLQGSKYIASNTGNTFSRVMNLLQNKKTVLYSGTPCQIAGLKQFLGKEYKNLYTVDVICHGTPSQKLFNRYKTWLEHKIRAGGGYNCIVLETKRFPVGLAGQRLL